ncbi:hypothetical protein KQX54_020987 [Cotesia glomerata]|uniref:Uncharacterized protein n=1 Tax=Cotesia glomerata TaxID=32391 RepID=A0AAV7I543_COTGL|nr:hypothetical protein KQX54_020987 [Cotesia glomerata]
MSIEGRQERKRSECCRWLRELPGAGAAYNSPRIEEEHLTDATVSVTRTGTEALLAEDQAYAHIYTRCLYEIDSAAGNEAQYAETNVDRGVCGCYDQMY